MHTGTRGVVITVYNIRMDLHTLLVFGHIAGTILGVGGATIAEVQIIQALRDGKVDSSERALMHANYTTIRVGMALIILSGLALVWWHLAQGNDWVITSAKIQVKDIMFVAIVANAIALTKRWVPLWLGAAVSFTSWWGATILGVMHRPPYSFLTLLIAYIVAIFVIAGIQHLIRRHFAPKHT